MKEVIRKCYRCGEKLTACFGYVNCTDFLKNKIPPRELCGKCVIKQDIKDGLLDEFIK